MIFDLLGMNMENKAASSTSEKISTVVDLLKWYGYVTGVQEDFCVVRLKIFRGMTVKTEDVIVPMSILSKV